MARKGGECIAPARFCGVGAWRVRSNFPVFLRSRDRGSGDAVVFPGICNDGYFYHKGCAAGLMIRRGLRSRVAVKQRRSEAIRGGEGLT